ncbi:RNA polymerase sigma factor [Streptomyces purpurogeneiscleroticus]|uniref:RNA polymerase sigma factor n=1 Tax=Streptomyces purpurogeneiscleroticus TaxID=68259 RepID=UPI001CC0F730|nr:RNA polymerase sigma factor [Streptomyces purpurogeneiscleroticus]MBZ4018706.1 RNA polymerase subunit sigma-24 [Streptomyces purpurogeneiscleroticus]
MSERLTERLATDLDSGFAELVRVHGSTVRTYLHRLSGSAADAEDLGQEAFLRAYKALRSYSAERCRELRPRAWLLSIATNVWRNDVRTKSRRPVSAARLEDASDQWPEAGPGPEEVVARGAERERLGGALSRLPEHYRQAVVMRHVLGMSYAEVAEAQGRPVGTVKAQVSRGLVILRALLGPDAPDSEVRA